MDVRTARPDDVPAIMGVLDAALLEADAEGVRRRVEREEVLVAETGTVVGALVLAGPEIEAVAVRRNRRGQGIGTALVEAALARRGRLVAAFDERVRPFYESLGFAIEPLAEDDRCVGVRYSND